VKIEADVLEALRKAGAPPQIAYGYMRTGGLLLKEDMREHWPPRRGLHSFRSPSAPTRRDRKAPPSRH